MAVQVRPARVEDADGIADIHIRSWQETYVGMVPDDYLADLPKTFDRRKEMWAKSIFEKNGLRKIFVADCEEKGIVGFAGFQDARDEEFKGIGELGAIYLLKAYHGQSIGFQLVKIGFEYLKQSGFEKAYCWVLKGNPTISFYQRTGAKLTDQTKTDEIRGFELHEVACLWEDINL